MAAAGMRTWTDALANVHGLADAAGKCKGEGGQAGRQAMLLLGSGRNMGRLELFAEIDNAAHASLLPVCHRP